MTAALCPVCGAVLRSNYGPVWADHDAGMAHGTGPWALPAPLVICAISARGEDFTPSGG